MFQFLKRPSCSTSIRRISQSKWISSLGSKGRAAEPKSELTPRQAANPGLNRDVSCPPNPLIFDPGHVSLRRQLAAAVGQQLFVKHLWLKSLLGDSLLFPSEGEESEISELLSEEEESFPDAQPESLLRSSEGWSPMIPVRSVLKTPWCSKTSRKTLPAEMISRNNFSVWSILKKCIGMVSDDTCVSSHLNDSLHIYHQHAEELSKIAMPVVFNEPLSFLQRISEYMEHTQLIHQACTLSDSIDRMQVSHHPPVSAFHAQSLKHEFEFHGSIDPKLKFWGKSYGTVEIINHSTGDKCVLNFKPVGMFGKELHRVEGHIQDKSKKKRRFLYGKWTECMYSIDPKVYDAHKNCEAEEADEMPDVQETVTVIPGSALLWRISPRPADSAQKERLEEKQRASRRDRSVEEEEWCTSWERTLTRERRIGSTQVDTLTETTLTLPTFIDTHLLLRRSSISGVI
ncbi:hypothetical protein F7725_001326 [Dissostichus mawsoni]|uniref:Uncharacterized protein n=1 Tax=Dissostichus mawsoni TaxID=36200 RepID=A0A7J5ZJ15_DISMA|nr:hypothetical protein F7725_001326 [Dissostichus mawsoni]